MTPEPLEPRRHLAATPSAPSFLALRSEGYASLDAVAATGDGGYVAAGTYAEGTSFGDPRGDSDAFVARYDAAGDRLWSLTFGGDEGGIDDRGDDAADFASDPRRAGEPFVYGVSARPRDAGEQVSAVRVSGDSVWVAGVFQGDVQFGDAMLANAGYQNEFTDGFVAELDFDDGAVERVSTLGGPFYDVISDLQVGPDGSIYLAGSAERDADFKFGRARYVAEIDGRGDAFVARYSPSLKLVYVSTLGGDFSGRDDVEAVNALAIEDDGSAYAVGIVASDVVAFSAGALESDRAEIYGIDGDGTDAFAMKLTPTGDLDWFRAQGGEDDEGNRAAALTPQGDLWTVGYFSGDEADLDPTPGVTVEFAAAADDGGDDPEFTDLVLTKYDDDGDLKQLRTLGGEWAELVGTAEPLPGGGVRVSGSFNGPVDFAPGRTRRVLTPPESDVDDSNGRDDDPRDFAYSGYVAEYDGRGLLRSLGRIDADEEGDLFLNAHASVGDALVVAGRARGGALAAGAEIGLNGEDEDDDELDDGFLFASPAEDFLT